MNRTGRIAVLTAGLGIATASVGHFYPSSVRAVDIQHVKVVNSSLEPVPVQGSVKASQSGAWNVGINGTPTVNVASAPPVNVTFPGSIGIKGTVPVQNAPGLFGFIPFVVQDFENPARFAFQETCAELGTGTASCVFVVPGTKSLVVETVSATLSTTKGTPLRVSLVTTVGGASGEHYFAPILTSSFEAVYTYAFNNDVRIYADPGSKIFAFVEASTFEVPVSFRWTISGHFVCKDFQQLC